MKNTAFYEAELKAVRKMMLPSDIPAVEIGVGTGRFAAPLGIETGVEPSLKMAELALERGISVIAGTAEKLPLKSGVFNMALLVTTVCFVDDIERTLFEAGRILKDFGTIIIRFVDSESRLGKNYISGRNESHFYKDAVFFSPDDVIRLLDAAGFGEFSMVQTLLGEHLSGDIEEGFGKGAFVVIRGVKHK